MFKYNKKICVTISAICLFLCASQLYSAWGTDCAWGWVSACIGWLSATLNEAELW